MINQHVSRPTCNFESIKECYGQQITSLSLDQHHARKWTSPNSSHNFLESFSNLQYLDICTPSQYYPAGGDSEAQDLVLASFEQVGVESKLKKLRITGRWNQYDKGDSEEQFYSHGMHNFAKYSALPSFQSMLRVILVPVWEDKGSSFEIWTGEETLPTREEFQVLYAEYKGRWLCEAPASSYVASSFASGFWRHVDK